MLILSIPCRSSVASAKIVQRSPSSAIRATKNPYSFSFGSDRKEYGFFVALERNPSDKEPVLLPIAAERDENRVADRDPRWQTDVVIGPAGAGNKPIPTFGQHPGAMRMHRFDSVGGGDAEADGDHEARKPPTNCHQSSPSGNDMLNLAV